jgi:hypothetical protein
MQVITLKSLRLPNDHLKKLKNERERGREGGRGRERKNK